MKKFVVLLAVLCLALAVALGFLAQTPMPLTGDSAETQEPAATAGPVRWKPWTMKPSTPSMTRRKWS